MRAIQPDRRAFLRGLARGGLLAGLGALGCILLHRRATGQDTSGACDGCYLAPACLLRREKGGAAE